MREISLLGLGGNGKTIHYDPHPFIDKKNSKVKSFGWFEVEEPSPNYDSVAFSSVCQGNFSIFKHFPQTSALCRLRAVSAHECFHKTSYEQWRYSTQTNRPCLQEASNTSRTIRATENHKSGAEC